MIDQLNMYGMTKLEVSIERIKQIEPRGGSWYLAFSGGKDSCVVKALCDMAGVKYDAHYRITSVDPPELVRFIKEKHPDVSMDFPRYKDGKVITMWNLIPTKTMPPTRIVRYCCQYLKENGGEGRDKITGVRWDESVRRRKKRSGLEAEDKKDRTRLDPDNMDEDMVRFCMQSKGFILNPIIDWTTDEVWEFIHRFNIPYCELYDQGFKRLGCIGCPMATPKEKKRQFERYPKFKEAYIRAFDRMIQNQISGGVLPRDKAKNCTNFGQPDKRYITDTDKLYTEWVHDRLQSGRYNDLVDTIGGSNEQRHNIRGNKERTRKSHHKGGELETRNTTSEEGI